MIESTRHETTNSENAIYHALVKYEHALSSPELDNQERSMLERLIFVTINTAQDYKVPMLAHVQWYAHYQVGQRRKEMIK